MKLQEEWIRFLFFFWTGFTHQTEGGLSAGLTGFFSPSARGPSAEGHSILTILLILSNYFLKIRIHSAFFAVFCYRYLSALYVTTVSFLIKLAAFQVSGNAQWTAHNRQLMFYIDFSHPCPKSASGLIS